MNASPYQPPPDKTGLPTGFTSGSLWRVVDEGEMDGLIGVFEDLLDANMDPVDRGEAPMFVLLFFPVSRNAQEKHGMVGANDYIGGIIGLLRDNNYRMSFDYKAGSPELEEVNPEEL